jgi:hypothetical protein
MRLKLRSPASKGSLWRQDFLGLQLHLADLNFPALPNAFILQLLSTADSKPVLLRFTGNRKRATFLFAIHIQDH